ncbi:DUF1836 domain-containing protein [Lachnospiraceae bacterium NSJ-143]|nr:DUF1836 domain-containing protein [Lachnospiraceae bacterium NSJ-143]
MEDLKIDFGEFSKKNSCYIIEVSDIPNIDLYMDQVTTFMETKLCGYKRNEKDKILTKTMINNYAKAKLFPPPVKKKYTKNHVMLLIIIYHLKNMLSINDISRIIQPVTSALNENPESIMLEELYASFVNMQKEAYSLISKKQSFDENFFSRVQISDKIQNKPDFAAILYVLGFSVFSNLEKRISEKIIDNMF